MGLITSRFPLPIFRSSPEIVSGYSALSALTGLRFNRAALIVSRTFAKSSLINTVISLLGAQSHCIIEKSWSGEPVLNELDLSIKKMFDFRPDIIIAIGGGSVIDGAKLCWLKYENPEKEITELTPNNLVLRKKSRFVAIPSTVGAGSEVSSAAAYETSENVGKNIFVNPQLISDVCILDPRLPQEVPREPLLNSVADALSHSIEGYVANTKHPIQSAFAKTAVAEVVSVFPSLHKEIIPLDDLLRLQNAALLSGWVQNHCMVGMSHAIAHQLSELDVPHGLANSALMPHVIEVNSAEAFVMEQYMEICRAANLDSIEELKSLFASLSSDSSPLKGQIIDAHRIAGNSLNDSLARNNPVAFSLSDTLKVLAAIS